MRIPRYVFTITRLDSNIKWKSSNNTYLKIIEILAAHHPTHSSICCTPIFFSKRGVSPYLLCVGCSSHYISLWYSLSIYSFTHFWMLLIVFNHANACASMRSLVKIHNNGHHFDFTIWITSWFTIQKRKSFVL